jgi:hypothetical protein
VKYTCLNNIILWIALSFCTVIFCPYRDILHTHEGGVRAEERQRGPLTQPFYNDGTDEVVETILGHRPTEARPLFRALSAAVLGPCNVGAPLTSDHGF